MMDRRSNGAGPRSHICSCPRGRQCSLRVQCGMVERGLEARDPLERLGLRVSYLITGPAAACIFARLAADRLGLWPIPQEHENVSFVLGQVASLLIEFFGLPIAVLSLISVVLTRKRWRDFLPLWFLAAGTGVGWFADWDAQSAALGDFAYSSLLLYGLSATWIGCIGGIARLPSCLAKRSS